MVDIILSTEERKEFFRAFGFHYVMDDELNNSCFYDGLDITIKTREFSLVRLIKILNLEYYKQGLEYGKYLRSQEISIMILSKRKSSFDYKTKLLNNLYTADIS